MDESVTARRPPIAADAPWREVVFVCRKCTRRADDEALAKLRRSLKQAIKENGLKKRVRLVECGCLDLCPRHGVVLAKGSELGGNGRKLRVHRRGDDLQATIAWAVNRSPESST